LPSRSTDRPLVATLARAFCFETFFAIMRRCPFPALLGLACLAGLLATASAGCFAPLPTLLAAKQTAVE
jgi:hypothetical protein